MTIPQRNCSPKCPARAKTKLFPSPNGNLPKDKLDQLQKCIEVANDLLRTLGNPQDPDNTTALRLHFRSKRGINVQMIVDCEGTEEYVAGCLEEVGRDFFQLHNSRGKIFVQFERTCSINRVAAKQCEDEQERVKIDPCLQQELVLSFGKVVSKNVSLLNLFFGVPLHRQLVSFIGKEAQAKTDNQQVLSGLLVNSEEGKFDLLIDNKIESVHFNELCFLTIFTV